MLALIAVLLVGLGLMALHPAQLPPWASAISSAITLRSEPARAADPSHPSHPPPKPPESMKRRAAVKEVPRTENPGTGLSARTAPERSPFPFPLAQQIVTGTPKADLLKSFGPAEATVTGADLGRLHERLVYIDKLSGRRTLIFLLNGRAVAAQTYVE
jgi:hypothetical protein